MKHRLIALFAALFFAFATPALAAANEYTGKIVERHGEHVLAIVFKKGYCVLCLYERHKWGALYDKNVQTFLKKVSTLNPGIVYHSIPEGTVVYFPLPRGMEEKINWYEKMIADLKAELWQKIAELLEEAQFLRQQNSILVRENDGLRGENTTLKNENSNLRIENANLKTEIRTGKKKWGSGWWWPWNWGRKSETNS
jgi:hypothetical protein